MQQLVSHSLCSPESAVSIIESKSIVSKGCLRDSNVVHQWHYSGRWQNLFLKGWHGIYLSSARTSASILFFRNGMRTTRVKTPKNTAGMIEIQTAFASPTTGVHVLFLFPVHVIIVMWWCQIKTYPYISVVKLQSYPLIDLNNFLGWFGLVPVCIMKYTMTKKVMPTSTGTTKKERLKECWLRRTRGLQNSQKCMSVEIRFKIAWACPTIWFIASASHYNIPCTMSVERRAIFLTLRNFLLTSVCSHTARRHKFLPVLVRRPRIGRWRTSPWRKGKLWSQRTTLQPWSLLAPQSCPQWLQLDPKYSSKAPSFPGTNSNTQDTISNVCQWDLLFVSESLQGKDT